MAFKCTKLVFCSYLQVASHKEGPKTTSSGWCLTKMAIFVDSVFFFILIKPNNLHL